MIQLALMGDTIKIRGTFKTFAGAAADPTDIVLKVFDERREQIGTDIAINEDHKTALGVYEYLYEIPYLRTDSIDLYFEMSGTLEGTTVLERAKVTVYYN